MNSLPGIVDRDQSLLWERTVSTHIDKNEFVLDPIDPGDISIEFCQDSNTNVSSLNMDRFLVFENPLPTVLITTLHYPLILFPSLDTIYGENGNLWIGIVASEAGS